MHKSLLLVLAGFAGGLGLSQTRQPDPQGGKPPAIPMQWYQFVLIERGPQYGKLSKEDTAEAYRSHFANMERHAKTGRLKLAGPFKDEAKAPEGTPAGLWIFDAGSVEAARELAGGDLCVQKGVFKLRMLDWYGPKRLSYEGAPAPEPAAQRSGEDGKREHGEDGAGGDAGGKGR